jgi:hydroxymethylglutaryl-CoA synthase
VLDAAKPGDRILIASFGSGAGSDAFSFFVTENINQVRKKAPSTKAYVDRAIRVDYSTYARWTNKLKEY